jgi:hypothetical protein
VPADRRQFSSKSLVGPISLHEMIAMPSPILFGNESAKDGGKTRFDPKRFRITRDAENVNLRFWTAISSRLFSFSIVSRGGETLVRTRDQKTEQEK